MQRSPPVPPKQFRAIALARGWKRKDLAARWNVTGPRITQITNDPDRAGHWDDALWGLPHRRVEAMVMARRRAEADSLVPESALQLTAAGAESGADTPGDDATIEPGDIWVVRESPGEHLPEGCEAEVTAMEVVDGVPSVSFRFETGETVTYPAEYLGSFACFLSATGRQGGLKSR